MDESSFLNPTAALAAAGLHEGQEVADFGTGSGFFARAAARAVGPQGSVWALDIDRPLLSRLRSLADAEHLRTIEVLAGDVEKGTELPPEQFDLVIISNLLFMVVDRAAVAREARRVLRRNGRALIIDWQDSFGGLGPQQSHIISAAKARKLFEAEGFHFERDVPAGAYHWGFVVRKKAPAGAQ